MSYSKELHDRVRQNLRMFDYPRFDDGDIDDLLDEIERLQQENTEAIDELKERRENFEIMCNRLIAEENKVTALRELVRELVHQGNYLYEIVGDSHGDEWSVTQKWFALIQKAQEVLGE